MITKQKIIEDLESIISEQFPEINIDTLDKASSLTDIGFASIDQIELIFSIEEKYDITIPNEELSQENTFDEIISYLENKINKDAE